ncbi:synaptosome-associated proteinsynaptosomal-associated protein 25 [Gloeopeniophorella convolvens]|nr:synaptosome-associated proteinsynaptosomal-associated protein 25 [Gloeopeniophorella convolvens]
MSWFNKRKERNLIPPVESDSPYAGGNSTSPRPAVRSAATSYVASRDGDPYSSRSAGSTPSLDTYPPVRDRYQRNAPVGDVYSRGQGNPDNDRKELFSGYNPEKASSGRFAHDGPTLREPAPGEENEEDVEGIKQQTRFVKQDSVNSTRNALRMAREAEETARGTINRLGDQSEKLANTERHLDVAKSHSQRAEDKTDELKKLNRSIFRPAITFNKDGKRAAQESKIQQRYDEERDEREKTMMDIRETQNRLGRATTYGQDDEGIGSGRLPKTATQQALRQEQRKRYQFEATASDDELEDELDDNLDEISDMTKRLKALGSAMGQELDKQNNRIERIEEKTVSLDNRVFRNTERLKRIK